MKAMILAAGRGARLKPVTNHTPKPLLELEGRPLIAHQLEWLRRGGIEEVVINLHHLGPRIEAALGDGSELGVAIHYSREPELLETGGGVKNALPLLGDAPFVILNGDIWTSFDFATLPTDLAGNLAHLVLIDKPAHRHEGDFDLVDGRVRRTGARAMVYCGISVLSPALFAGTPDGPFSLGNLLFEAAEAGRVAGARFTGTWFDIGSPDQLARARRSSAPTESWGQSRVPE